MQNNIYAHIVVSLVLIFLLLFFLNPLDLLMPSTFSTMSAFALILVFGIFVGLIWKEQAHDEREELLRMLAGRVSFLVGCGVLLVALLVESGKHMIDPWLVTAFVVMVVTKLISLLYASLRK